MEIEERIAKLEESLMNMANDQEDLYYSFMAQKCSKKTIEEIVENAVMQYFSVTKRDFYGKSYMKLGKPAILPEQDRNVIDGRKWFVSVMRYILLKSTYSMKLNYPFYAQVMEVKHRKVFAGAVNPQSEKDQANRKILFDISDLIKKSCKDEGILSDQFEV